MLSGLSITATIQPFLVADRNFRYPNGIHIEGMEAASAAPEKAAETEDDFWCAIMAGGDDGGVVFLLKGG